MVDGDTGRLSFQLPELSIAASFRNRQPWSEERPNSSGPEGWLQRTGLLPLHYFVVSEILKAWLHSRLDASPGVQHSSMRRVKCHGKNAIVTHRLACRL